MLKINLFWYADQSSKAGSVEPTCSPEFNIGFRFEVMWRATNMLQLGCRIAKACLTILINVSIMVLVLGLVLLICALSFDRSIGGIHHCWRIDWCVFLPCPRMAMPCHARQTSSDQNIFLEPNFWGLF